MTIKELLAWLFLAVACGSCASPQMIDTSVEGLVPVELLNDPYEIALEAYLGEDLDFSGVRVYEGLIKPVNEACDMEYKVVACANGIQGVIVTSMLSNCMVTMHEFLHIALYQIHGDGDFHHEHELFDADTLISICEEYNL